MQRAFALLLCVTALVAGPAAGCGDEGGSAPADGGAATATPTADRQDDGRYGY